MDTRLTCADGHAKRIAALPMIERRVDQPKASSVSADKANEAQDFVNALRSMNVHPHVAPEHHIVCWQRQT